ncbi:O-antigen ligase family protein [Ancylobacter sp. 6x-1]|uniref:O-antigen ligase family protein n=1 Tax=Ancylobacter crimeensis TaxID=2579147 RepID=A0ABT0D6M6_9HYPH|nr:O-antigen ligase family protein [Ancylobacter crimeensis]MCK0195596.1 O-antigen ligase family protein [Ancylobacter crimeensis]
MVQAEAEYPSFLAPVHVIFFPLCVVTLLFALTFGGGQVAGRWPDALVQLVSFPLFILLVGSLLLCPQPRWLRRIALVIGLLWALPLLQLVPLPPWIWTHLPGRALVAHSYEVAGLDLPWRPLSLNPEGTVFSLVSLMPAVTIFLSCLMLDQARMRVILLTLLGFALANVVIGMVQITFWRRFMRVFGRGDMRFATGLYTNRNNLAALFYATLPIPMVLAAIQLRSRSDTRFLSFAVAALVSIILFFGILTARSRAGFALGTIVLLGMLAALFMLNAVYRTHEGSSSRWAKLALGTVVLVVFTVVFDLSFGGVASRLDSNIGSDLRWPMAATTFEVLKAYFPFGSGLGSFVPVYAVFQDNSTLIRPYVNHAHNDWLELVMEGGVAGLVLLVAVAAMGALATLAAFRRRSGYQYKAYAAAGFLAAVALLLHSALEYPLRIESLMVVFAVMCSLVVRAAIVPIEPEASVRPHRRRHRRVSSAAAEGSIALPAE